jgi:hypothetical protein
VFRVIWFISLGIILAAIGMSALGAWEAFGWTFAVGMTLFVLSSILVIFASVSIVGGPPASPKLIETALRQHRGALVRIDRLRNTTTEINDQPVCELEVTVRSAHGLVYRTKLRRVIRLTELVTYQRGTVHPGVVLTEDGPELALLEEGEAASAAFAQTRGLEIPEPNAAGDFRVAPDGIVRDNGTRRKPLLGRGKKGRAGRRVLYVVAILAGIAIAVLPNTRFTSYTALALQQGQLTLDNWDSAYLEYLIPKLEDELGHDLVEAVYIGDAVIGVNAPIGIDTTNSDSWTIRNGGFERNGPYSGQPESSAEFFSLDDVNWAGIEPLVERALDEARSEIGEVTDDNISVSVDRATDDDVESDQFGRPVGDIEIRISLTGDYSSASFVSDGAAEKLELISIS